MPVYGIIYTTIFAICGIAAILGVFDTSYEERKLEEYYKENYICPMCNIKYKWVDTSRNYKRLQHYKCPKCGRENSVYESGLI